MSSDKDYLLPEFELATMLVRQDQTTLLICRQMLSAGIKLANKTPLFLRIQPGVAFNAYRHLLHHLRRHHHQKSVFQVRYGKELVHLTAAPACRDGNAIFRVHRVPELAGKNWQTLLRCFHGKIMVKKTILNHNAPLLPTQRHAGQLNSSNFARFCLPLSAAFVPQPVKPVSACANQPLLERNASHAFQCWESVSTPGIWWDETSAE